MWTRHRKQPRFRLLVLPAVAMLSLAYFGFHGVNGHYGLKSKETYELRIVALKSELQSLKAARAVIERRTNLLRTGNLERDMIDEQARRALGLTKSNEIVLLHPAN